MRLRPRRAQEAELSQELYLSRSTSSNHLLPLLQLHLRQSTAFSSARPSIQTHEPVRMFTGSHANSITLDTWTPIKPVFTEGAAHTWASPHVPMVSMEHTGVVPPDALCDVWGETHVLPPQEQCSEHTRVDTHSGFLPWVKSWKDTMWTGYRLHRMVPD